MELYDGVSKSVTRRTVFGPSIAFKESVLRELQG